MQVPPISPYIVISAIIAGIVGAMSVFAQFKIAGKNREHAEAKDKKERQLKGAEKLLEAISTSADTISRISTRIRYFLEREKTEPFEGQMPDTGMVTVYSLAQLYFPDTEDILAEIRECERLWIASVDNVENARLTEFDLILEPINSMRANTRNLCAALGKLRDRTIQIVRSQDIL